MSNLRASGQKLISLAVSENFLERVDAALPRAGYGDRSQFIRDAVLEKLQRAGIELPLELAAAPSRKGKGGRRPKADPAAPSGVKLPPARGISAGNPAAGFMLNEGGAGAKPEAMPATPKPIHYGKKSRSSRKAS